MLGRRLLNLLTALSLLWNRRSVGLTPPVTVTGHAEPEWIDKCRAAGFESFLTKPATCSLRSARHRPRRRRGREPQPQLKSQAMSPAAVALSAPATAAVSSTTPWVKRPAGFRSRRA